MALAGCLYRLAKAAEAALEGDKKKAEEELSNAVDACGMPPFSF